MQAVGGGVEAAVEGDFVFGEKRVERGDVGGLRDKAARLEVLDNGGHGA